MESFTQLLQQFVGAVMNPHWTEESTFILQDFQHAVFSSDTFVERDTHIEDRVIVSELEWTGEGKSVNDISKAFWKLYGDFGEMEQFVCRQIEQDSLNFYIISGNTAEHRAHGHLLRVRIVGERVATITKEYFRIGAEIERSIDRLPDTNSAERDTP